MSVAAKDPNPVVAKCLMGWMGLHPLGTQLDPLAKTRIRQCVCGSTVSRVFCRRCEDEIGAVDACPSCGFGGEES